MGNIHPVSARRKLPSVGKSILGTLQEGGWFQGIQGLPVLSSLLLLPKEAGGDQPTDRAEDRV